MALVVSLSIYAALTGISSTTVLTGCSCASLSVVRYCFHLSLLSLFLLLFFLSLLSLLSLLYSFVPVVYVSPPFQILTAAQKINVLISVIFEASTIFQPWQDGWFAWIWNTYSCIRHPKCIPTLRSSHTILVFNLPWRIRHNQQTGHGQCLTRTRHDRLYLAQTAVW